MTELKLNEKELIQLTIDYGYDGSELNNKHFIEKGYLKNNNKYQKFIEKVKSICESYEKLRKVKGEAHPYYIINGLKPKDNIEMIVEDERSTAQHDDYIKIMAKHLFNHLLDELNGKSYTLNKWMTSIGGLNSNDVVDDDLIFKCFDELYYGADLKEIKNATITYFKSRNQRVMEQMIKNLLHQNLISVYNEFGAITIDNKFISIEEETYAEWRVGLELIVTNHNLEMSNYKYFINRDGYEDFTEEYELYIEQTEIKNAYKTYTLNVIAKESQPFKISYSEFQNAYNDKLIKQIVKLDECSAKNQYFFTYRFNKFNYLTILKNANWTIHIDDDLIKEFEPIPFAIDLMINERKNHKGMEKVVDRWRKANDSFGALIEGNITLDEFENGVTESDSVTEHNTLKKDSKPTYSLDELLSDVQIPHYTYIPFDLSDTKQDTYKDTIHNNQALKDAVNNIRIAFQSQPIAVGSFC